MFFEKRSHPPKQEGLRVQGSLGRPCCFGGCLLLRQEDHYKEYVHSKRIKKKTKTTANVLTRQWEARMWNV